MAEVAYRVMALATLTNASGLSTMTVTGEVALTSTVTHSALYRLVDCSQVPLGMILEYTRSRPTEAVKPPERDSLAVRLPTCVNSILSE